MVSDAFPDSLFLFICCSLNDLKNACNFTWKCTFEKENCDMDSTENTNEPCCLSPFPGTLIFLFFYFSPLSVWDSAFLELFHVVLYFLFHVQPGFL